MIKPLLRPGRISGAPVLPGFNFFPVGRRQAVPRAVADRSWSPLHQSCLLYRPLDLQHGTRSQHYSTSALQRSIHHPRAHLRRPTSEKIALDLDQTKTEEADPADQLFKLSLEISRVKPSVDVTVRCTEFDSDGSPNHVARELDKSELIAEYGLQARDLRKLDIKSSTIPHIFVRPSTIMVNLLQLRLLIQSDRVLVLDADGTVDDQAQAIFAYNLEHRIAEKHNPNKAPNLPYEFRALEAVLISVTSGLEAELVLVREPVMGVLNELQQDVNVDPEIVRRLLEQSKKLGTFERKARLVRDALQELLDADDDLATMYLTDHKNGKPHTENDHQEVELLLESYEKVCDEIVEVCNKVQDDVHRTEEATKAILDADRNQIMLLEVKVNICMLGLGASTFIAGLYGMNLINYMEDASSGFAIITSVCVTLSTIIIIFGSQKLRKIQRHRIFSRRGT